MSGCGFEGLLAASEDQRPSFNVDLKQLIQAANQGEVSLVACKFDEIQDCVRKMAVGGIPQKIVEELGFERLTFSCLDEPNNEDFLFLGHEGKVADRCVDRALVTITMVRFVTASDDLKFWSVGVCGFNHSLGRVVAAKYLAENQGCVKFDISLSPMEKEALGFASRDMRDYFLYGNPHYISAPVSEAMLERTASAAEDQHNFFLRFNSSTVDPEDVKPELLPGYLRVEQDSGFHKLDCIDPSYFRKGERAEEIWKIFKDILVPIRLDVGE